MKSKRRIKKSVKTIILSTIIIILITSLIVIVFNFAKENNQDKNKDDSSNNKLESTYNDSMKKEEKNMFEEETYYIEDNLSRYEAYYQNNQDLSPNEIVKRVNSNLDKTFYVDVTPTDLSKNNLVIVNKFFYLEKDYVPENLVELTGYGNGSLVKEAYDAYVNMYNAAKDDGMNLYVSTSYRNYNFQSTLYYNYVNEDGQEAADTYSARPGYSEHQTGLAVDLGTSTNHSITQFKYSNEFNWMQENAYKYGFIQRYNDNTQYITGYQTEEWHYRYVGVDVAKYIYENNITFEEYYAYYVDQNKN